MIGRSEDSQFCLPHDRYFSRHHGLLEIAPPQCFLRDLGSTNGTFAREDFNASTSQITLNFDWIQADNQPTIAPHAVLWSGHIVFLANMSAQEHRRSYFLHLYYQNKDEN